MQRRADRVGLAEGMEWPPTGLIGEEGAAGAPQAVEELHVCKTSAGSPADGSFILHFTLVVYRWGRQPGGRGTNLLLRLSLLPRP